MACESNGGVQPSEHVTFYLPADSNRNELGPYSLEFGFWFGFGFVCGFGFHHHRDWVFLVPGTLDAKDKGGFVGVCHP